MTAEAAERRYEKQKDILLGDINKLSQQSGISIEKIIDYLCCRAVYVTPSRTVAMSRKEWQDLNDLLVRKRDEIVATLPREPTSWPYDFEGEAVRLTDRYLILLIEMYDQAHLNKSGFDNYQI